MLCHLFADVVEEEGAGNKAAGSKKKGGGSMQTISATHRVSSVRVKTAEIKRTENDHISKWFLSEHF